MIQDIIAICFSFHSIDFLLQYSFDPDIPPIHNHKPHLGDIINTDHTNVIQLKIKSVIRIILIFFIKK